MEILQRTPPEV